MRMLLVASGLLLGVPSAWAQGTLYGVDIGQDLLLTINPATAIAVPVGPVGNDTLTGLAADPATNTLYGIDPATGNLYKVNPATGATSLLAAGLFTANANGLAFDPAGNRLLISDNNNNQLHQYDLTTGTPSLLSTISGTTDIEGLAFDTSSQTLFGLSDGITEAVYKIHAPSGQTSMLAALPAGRIWRGLDMDSATGTIYAMAVNPNRLTTISVSTGAVTDLGTVLGSGVFCQGLAFMPEVAGCYPDCDGDGLLSLADFGCFQTKFGLGDPYADCDGDGLLTLADFGCFQTAFGLGCP